MTHPTRRSLLRASLGIAAAGALAPPSIANAQAKTASTPTPTPKLGGTINMHSYSFPPPNWHPHVTNTVQVISYSGIYNQLIEYNPETEDPFDLRGDLATSWELSEDGKVYTFHLNPKARWQDGTPVTAEDVVYSMDSMVDADAKPPRVVTLPALSPYYQKGTARAIDAHTVEIPLKIPGAPDFLPTLALDFCKIVAKHWGESGTDVQKWENAIGSGPFKPGKFVKDVSIELVKNKDYWKPELPRIDGMVHYTIKDKGTAIAAYKTGRVLMTNFAVTDLSNKEAVQLEKEANDKLRVEYVRDAIFFFFFMNTSVAPFDNPKVRQAVNLALDRQALFNTFGVPGLDSLAPPLGVGTWFGSAPGRGGPSRWLQGRDDDQAGGGVSRPGCSLQGAVEEDRHRGHPQARRQRHRVPALFKRRLGDGAPGERSFPHRARCRSGEGLDAGGDMGKVCQVRSPQLVAGGLCPAGGRA